MTLEALSTTYIFTCDHGMILDREVADRVLIHNKPNFSEDQKEVIFTVYEDNSTVKAQKIRGALWYSQKEE